MSYLIKGGIIAEQNRYTPVDILVEGNVIKKIGKIDKADHILDASGMILFLDSFQPEYHARHLQL